MKTRTLFFIIAIICSLATYSQQTDGNEMPRLVNACRQIVERNDSIEKLKQVIESKRQQLTSLCQSWEVICQNYMGSSDQCIQDLDSLLKYTDKELEKELYGRLMTARAKIEATGQGQIVIEPISAVTPPPIPVADPKPEVIKDNNDGKGNEAGDKKDNDSKKDKKDKKDTKKDNDMDDMNGMKSKIKNKDENN